MHSRNIQKVYLLSIHISLQTCHLLPGIPTGGVPRGLRGTAIPFHYNDFDELLDIVNKNPDLAAVKMEVCRNFGPEDGFLEKIMVASRAYPHFILTVHDSPYDGYAKVEWAEPSGSRVRSLFYREDIGCKLPNTEQQAKGSRI